MKLKTYPLPNSQEIQALQAMARYVRIAQEIIPGIYLYDKQTFVEKYPEHAQKIVVRDEQELNSPAHLMIRDAGSQEWVVVIESHVRLEHEYVSLAAVHALLPEGMIKRLHIIIEDHARVALQETSCINIHDTPKIQSMNIYVGKHAQCKFLFSGQEHTFMNPALYYTWQVTCDESAEFNMTLTLGAHTLIVHEIMFLLYGAHAQAHLYSAYANKNESAIFVHTQQLHQAPYTRSSVLAKGALTGSAYADYRGIITIDRSAAHADARQDNKHILLSDHAHAMSVPALEVLNPEVQCFHGSATGQIDAEQVYYAGSRGLPEERARTLMLEGYFGEVLDTILDKNLAHTILQKLLSLLA